MHFINNNRFVFANCFSLYDMIQYTVRLFDCANNNVFTTMVTSLSISLQWYLNLGSIITSNFDLLAVNMDSFKHGMELIILLHNQTDIGKN